MRHRKALTVGIVAGAVALGGVIGALAFAPVVGSAQESGDQVSWPDERCSGFGEGPVAVAAEAIGIAPRDLLEALTEGRTIAQVAEANGVNVSAVVDAIVESVEERLAEAVDEGWLTQAEADEKGADLEERVTDLVNGDLSSLHRGPGLGLGFGRGPGFRFGHGHGLGHGPWGGAIEDGTAGAPA
ncbi:MAG TPA: hypothetical protein VF029_05590 [Actinomycetota bacterium]